MTGQPTNPPVSGHTTAAMETSNPLARLDSIATPPGAGIGRPAPDFEATAVINKRFEQVRLSEYRGRYVVLFFWPLDFTFVCPTEIVAFSDAVEAFAERDTVVLGVSVDSQYTHLAWQNMPRAEGGLDDVAFAMMRRCASWTRCSFMRSTARCVRPIGDLATPALMQTPTTPRRSFASGAKQRRPQQAPDPCFTPRIFSLSPHYPKNGVGSRFYALLNRSWRRFRATCGLRKHGSPEP